MFVTKIELPVMGDKSGFSRASQNCVTLNSLTYYVTPGSYSGENGRGSVLAMVNYTPCIITMASIYTYNTSTDLILYKYSLCAHVVLCN